MWKRWNGRRETIPSPGSYSMIRHRDSLERAPAFVDVRPYFWGGDKRRPEDIVAFKINTQSMET